MACIDKSKERLQRIKLGLDRPQFPPKVWDLVACMHTEYVPVHPDRTSALAAARRDAAFAEFDDSEFADLVEEARKCDAKAFD